MVTDSTVGHHNYDADGAWTGWGDAAVVDALRARGIAATVDAVCGSGSWRARGLAPPARAAPAGAEVLLVGGWNDVGHPAARLRAAVAGAVSAARGAGRAARPCAARVSAPARGERRAGEREAGARGERERRAGGRDGRARRELRRYARPGRGRGGAAGRRGVCSGGGGRSSAPWA